MVKLSIATAIAGVVLAGSAFAAAPVLVAGQYTSLGIVASNNGATTCSAVGLGTNSTVNSIVKYPGAGKTGFILYDIPFGGGIQLCSGFPAVPAGGLNGFSGSAKCTLTTINGGPPASTVSFSFTATTTDANSGVGTTNISIPATAAVGAGCQATVDTTLVRSGK